MANTPPYTDPPALTLDIEQLQLDVQHRWLHPREVAEILRNHRIFHLSSKPPDRPPSGSVFLFNRKELRYFRNDGHIWRKKNDRKTVREGHENLKVGGVDVLHVYYATGEENACFRRRSYWLLEKKFSDIVFVHYLEVKCLSVKRDRWSVIDEPCSVVSNSQLGNSLSSSVSVSHNEAYVGNNVFPRTARTLTSTIEYIESGVGAEIDQKWSPKDKNAQIAKHALTQNNPSGYLKSRWIFHNWIISEVFFSI